MNKTITGFLAWHPNHELVNAEFYFSPDELIVLNLLCLMEGGEGGRFHAPNVEKVKAAGWQIREVEISFKDE